LHWSWVSLGGVCEGLGADGLGHGSLKFQWNLEKQPANTSDILTLLVCFTIQERFAVQTFHILVIDHGI